MDFWLGSVTKKVALSFHLAPVVNAYVRLLDSTGEFTAEVPTNADGQFRFFAAPGAWTLVVLASGVREERKVIAAKGAPVDLVVEIK